MGEREEGGEEGGRNKRERKGERVEGGWTERGGESRRKREGGGKSGWSQKYIQPPDLNGTSPPAQRCSETLEISSSSDTT